MSSPLKKKTPVMVLQEYVIKRKLSPPEYRVIEELTRQGTHENEFHYTVYAAGLTARGCGSSKQIAKHESAKNLLDQLKERGLLEPGESNIQDFIPGRLATVNDGEVINAMNSIFILSEMCENRKLPLPQFTEISAVGPPHCKDFTYECAVGSVRKRATARTKKHAKQISAKEVIDAITEILPEIMEECAAQSEMKALTDKDEEIMQTFSKIAVLPKVVQNKTIQIKEYPNVFKNLLINKELRAEPIIKMLESGGQENFERALEQMELTPIVRIISTAKGYVISLNLNTESPFTVLGLASSYEEAVQNAVNRAINLMIKCLK